MLLVLLLVLVLVLIRLSPDLRIFWCLAFPWGFGYLRGEPVIWKPRPGQGPPPWLVKRGGFTMEVTATSDATGDSAVAVVSGRGDPGYGATSKMLAETALALAFDEAAPGGGVLTPATALGGVLVERLNRSEHNEMTLRVSGRKKDE